VSVIASGLGSGSLELTQDATSESAPIDGHLRLWRRCSGTALAAVITPAALTRFQAALARRPGETWRPGEGSPGIEERGAAPEAARYRTQTGPVKGSGQLNRSSLPPPANPTNACS
jgi:hypothetical protein